MKIGIIAAMEEEKKLLEECMNLDEVVEIAGWKYLIGHLAKHEIVLVQSGIGKVMSAIVATTLIETFHVNFIINTGSAGGLHPKLRIGDIVVGKELAYSDVDVTAFGYVYGQLPQQPARYDAGEKYIQLAKQAAKRVDLTAYEGLIVTADSFIHEKEQYQKIQHHFPDVWATEMEGAAISQVGHVFQIPVLVIRAISDIPMSGTSAVSFDEFIIEAGKRSALFVCALLAYLSGETA